MAKLKAKELQAIGWFIENYKLKLQLSTPPTMYFKNEEGKVVTHDLAGIVLEFNAWNEQDQKERAREKRVADTRRVIKSGIL